MTAAAPVKSVFPLGEILARSRRLATSNLACSVSPCYVASRGRNTMNLLIYAPAYERVRARMPAGVTPLLIHPDGSLTLNGESIAAEDARFDIAWASTDLYVKGPSRANFALLTAAKGLKWFQSGAAGFDHPIFAKVAATGTIMTRSDAQGVAIAEFVLARTLECFQDAAGRAAKQKAHEWGRHPFRDIWGTTWLVIGYGAIGREIGIRARAFGAEVIG